MDARSFAFAAQGRIKEAIANYDHMIERYHDKLRVVVASRFAAFLEMSDDFFHAQSVCDEWLRSAREMGDGGLECAALYRRGIIQARQGKLEEAGLTAEELRQAVEAGPAKNRIRFYEGLAGLIALLRKDPSAAQGHLQKAINLAPIEGHCGDNISELLDFQAAAYELLGRWEDARRSYEELQSIKIPNLFPANALISARSYYKLGKVLERQGDKAGAAKNYSKFLDLWKHADQGLPEVEDAKKRLAAI
ncbi:MAG: tetratricopeptide repeat protein [Candidatus Aminicenantes bacterium]|nr:tetratricopeptide repeat protein [Candidatus Aminicenantes bacterium]